MIKKFILYIAVFFFVFGLRAADGRDVFSVYYPPDNTIMEFGLLSVTLSTAGGPASEITVHVNGREKLKIVPDSEFACFTVPIDVGINRIIIKALKGDELLDEAGINVFRRSDLESRYVKAPPEYEKDYFHMRKHEKCVRCHKLGPEEADKKPVNIAAFPSENLSEIRKEAEATSTCYSCHKGLLSYPFLHGPASVWSCLSCHDPGTEPKYSVMKPDTKICFSCHLTQKEEWYSRKLYHGPFNTGKCAICHNPHASDIPFNLIKSTWDLCVSCHIDKGSGRHIVEGYFSSATAVHPTRGVPDPLRKGKELSCASCHNAHASDAPKLWRFKVGSGFELCRKCHGK